MKPAKVIPRTKFKVNKALTERGKPPTEKDIISGKSFGPAKWGMTKLSVLELFQDAAMGTNDHLVAEHETFAGTAAKVKCSSFPDILWKVEVMIEKAKGEEQEKDLLGCGDEIEVGIANRLVAEKAAALIETPHAIISISDSDSHPPQFAANEYRAGILSLQFDDLQGIRADTPVRDTNRYRDRLGLWYFSDDHAAQIVDFVEGLKDRVKGLLVHCEAGISRSAAVAAVIELMLNGSDARVLNDPQYSPNPYVYQKLLRLWRKRGNG